MTPSPQDILKLRAQLMRQQPQVQVEQPPVASPSGTGNSNELPFALQNTIQASQSTPQPISPREEALSSYRQAMQQQAPQAPSQADYQPSIGRRIIGGLLGAGVGLSNPQAGEQLASNIISSPYNKALVSYNTQMTDYQKGLAQKKEAYETEAGAELGESKIAETEAQKEAEAARAGAEEARRKGEEWKVSPPGQEFAIKLAEAKKRAATSKESKLYNVNLKNGESATVTRDASGQLMLGDTPLGEDAYDASTLREIGTTLPKDPREESAKNRNEYNDFATGTKEKHPEMDSADIAEAWKDKEAQIGAKYEKSPQSLFITPEGKPFVARSGGPNVPEGSISPSGESSQNVDTAPTRQMQETAPKIIDLVDRTTQLIDQQIKSLGPAASRWSEFMAGKVGAPNPEFTRLRTNAALLQTLLLRMHIGSRGGQQIMAHFKDLIDAGKQSPENLKAALEEIKAYAQDISKSSKSGTKGPEVKKPLTTEELRKKYEY